MSTLKKLLFALVITGIWYVIGSVVLAFAIFSVVTGQVLIIPFWAWLIVFFVLLGLFFAFKKFLVAKKLIDK